MSTKNKILVYAANLQSIPVQQLGRHLITSALGYELKGLTQPNAPVLSSASETLEWFDRNRVTQPNATESLTQYLQGCNAVVLFIHTADLLQVAPLTRVFVQAATQAGVSKLIWVAPACGGTSDLGNLLAQAENYVRTAALESLVLRHAPLFSELLHHRKELKFRRTLSLPLGNSSLPWLAPEAIAQGCYRWLCGEINSNPPQVLTGTTALTGNDIASAFSEVLKNGVNSHTFAQNRFAAIDLDRSGEIDSDELFPYLLELGYGTEEAQTILETADTDKNGVIDFTEFQQGLEEHLDKILAEVPVDVQYINVSKSASLYDLMSSSMHELSATSWLDLLENLTTEGLPEQGQELTEWLGHEVPNLTEWASQYALDWINVHILPGRGILTVNEGLFEGHPALISRLLPAGDRLLTFQRTLDFKTVAMHRADADNALTEVVRYQPQDDEERVLELQDGKIVGLLVRGSWRGLRLASELLFSQQSLPQWQKALFRELGELQIEEASTLGMPEDVLCNCTQTTCGKIQALIDGGLINLEKLAESTQVTMICGGCKPLLEEMLGSASLVVGELVAKENLGAGMARLQLRPVNQPVVPSLPGQHLLVQGRVNGRWITRAYTLTSGADETNHYEITIKREELGEFSRWLYDRADSESLLRLSEPRGDFFVDDSAKSVVFFAGGIGVTPAIAAIRTLIDRDDSRPLHLDWSAPYPEHFVFKSELEKLIANRPNITMTMRATRVQGKIQLEEVHKQYPSADGAVAFICGPEPFMDTVRDYLQQAGWAEESIRQELFTSKLDREGNVEDSKPIRAAIQVAGGVTPIEQESFDVEPISSVMSEAEAFLKQCYIERGLPQVFLERWQEVRQSIESTGTYEHTYDELSYGSKLAWRNSNRCLGRNFWQNLNVRDMRHLETPEQMFDAILDHIKIATNNGDLRATITIFKPDGRRIWNPQYFRYAGYRQPDGSILGDPDNVELTNEALKLGWSKETKTRFDYLPIIIQLPESEPQWFEIPPELILEVPFSHPRYEWFEELGLKWYGLPAVSGMAFDIGGIQYTASPFNGFYMGAEIGSRNFSDTYRYNMLPEIAKRIGLDCSQNMTLWRDLAIVELNVAVLHSYKKSGVRMLDHHTLTDSFMQFVETEHKCGRLVQADRDYIIPPISASTTPVFTQTFDSNRKLKPNFFYQPDSWKENSVASGCPFHSSN